MSGISVWPFLFSVFVGRFKGIVCWLAVWHKRTVVRQLGVGGFEHSELGCIGVPNLVLVKYTLWQYR
jgi:hypothetical protein